MGISSEADDGSEEWTEADDLPIGQVKKLFIVLGKALRAFQLYDENNPVRKRFVDNLRESFESLWQEIDGLNLAVEEDRFLMAGEEVYHSTTRSDSLSFLLFKDGIRDISFLPGVEGDELDRFLGLLQRARMLKSAEADDVLTMLWEAEFQSFKWNYVDQLGEGVALPEARPAEERAELGQVFEAEAELDEGDEEAAEQDGQSAPQAPPKIGSDFNPALFSLDPAEKEQLERELAAEMARDLRHDVLSALFDRLEEEGHPERQSEILRIFRELLPNFLSRGEVAAAAVVLEELAAVRTTPGAMDDQRQLECDRLLDEISSLETIEELVRALQDGTVDVPAEVLDQLLKHLRSGALPVLLRAVEREIDATLREKLREAIRGIAAQNQEALVDLLDDVNPLVVAGAVRLVAEMEIADTGPKVAMLMNHIDGRVRLASVEAAVRIANPSSTAGLSGLLGDVEHDVRVAASRGLAELNHIPAVPALKAVVTGKAIRLAHLSEKSAVFESYATLGGSKAVEILGGLLNRKGFLGRREPSEIRACAARALGKIELPAARDALEAAKDESDALVRTAVREARSESEAPA